MNAKRKNFRDEEMQRICERWNAAHPVGTPVTLENDSGTLVDTKTRSEACVCESGYPVCFFEGISGYYLLARATAKPATEQTK
jgi:hypothetical protein